MVRCLRRPMGVPIFALAVIVGLWLLRTTQQLYFPGRVGRRKSWHFRSNTESIHVCLCSDDTDLRPAFVAINSAWSAASEPSRLVFHFITTPELARVAQEVFQQHLPDIKIEVHHDAALQAQIQSTISFRESSKARKILASPFNFAPFYLHKYLSKGTSGQLPKRLLYVDTDTLILGDVGELADIDMKGYVCGAVSYCLQRFGDYLNFDMLRELGYHHFNPKQCIANRGVVILDVSRWIQTNMTGKIEQWMVHYRNSRDDLWYGGMSQPPWLLAMNGDYLELGGEWNCNSLGRETMVDVEARTLRRSGFDKEAMATLGVSIVQFGATLPYVVTCTESGKLLHYNGAMKPWAPERWPKDKMWPACVLPDWFVGKKVDWSWTRTVQIFCEDQQFVACPDLWNYFITAEASSSMKRMSDDVHDEQAAREQQRRAELLWQQEAKAKEEELKRAEEQQLQAEAEARVEGKAVEEAAADAVGAATAEKPLEVAQDGTAEEESSKQPKEGAEEAKATEDSAAEAEAKRLIGDAADEAGDVPPG